MSPWTLGRNFFFNARAAFLNDIAWPDFLPEPTMVSICRGGVRICPFKDKKRDTYISLELSLYIPANCLDDPKIRGSLDFRNGIQSWDTEGSRLGARCQSILNNTMTGQEVSRRIERKRYHKILGQGLERSTGGVRDHATCDLPDHILPHPISKRHPISVD